MPLPLFLWFIAAGAYGTSHLLQEAAKEKEQHASRIDSAASKMWQEASEIFNDDVQRYKNYCNRRRAHIEAIYLQCLDQANPIFERFATGLEEMASWPMPPDFKQVDAIPIPDPPTQTQGHDADYYRILLGWTANKEFDDKFDQGVKYIGFSNNQAFMNHQAVSPAPALAAGAALLMTSIDRYTNAVRAMTTATEVLAETKKLITQVEDNQPLFRALKMRAETLARKVDSMKVYFDRYLAPAHEIHASGRVGSELDDTEWLNVKYLGRVFVCLTQVCKEPLV
jgi:hypothetical protein